MLITENGDIGCVTKNLGTQLGLLGPSFSLVNKNVNIRLLSKDLELANEVFNLVARSQAGFHCQSDASAKKTTVSKDIGVTCQSIPSRLKSFETHQGFRDSHEVPKKLNYTKKDTIRKVYSAYIKEGRSITVGSLRQIARKALLSEKSSYKYNCRIINLFSGHLNMKLATFRQISQTLESDISSQDCVQLKQDLTNFDDNLEKKTHKSGEE